jgi:hypothetical protein
MLAVFKKLRRDTDPRASFSKSIVTPCYRTVSDLAIKQITFANQNIAGFGNRLQKLAAYNK